METTLTRKHFSLEEVCLAWEGFLLFMGKVNCRPIKKTQGGDCT